MEIERNNLSALHSPETTINRRLIPAVPLTREGFAPFGDVIQAWANPLSAPRGIKVTPVNQDTAHKFHKLSSIVSSYPSDMITGPPRVSVYRCTPPAQLAVPVPQEVDIFEAKLLERHLHTNQLFIPMGNGTVRRVEDDVLPVTGKAYLVVVAQNGTGNDFFSVRILAPIQADVSCDQMINLT
jgi:allantoicase